MRSTKKPQPNTKRRKPWSFSKKMASLQHIKQAADRVRQKQASLLAVDALTILGAKHAGFAQAASYLRQTPTDLPQALARAFPRSTKQASSQLFDAVIKLATELRDKKAALVSHSPSGSL